MSFYTLKRAIKLINLLHYLFFPPITTSYHLVVQKMYLYVTRLLIPGGRRGGAEGEK